VSYDRNKLARLMIERRRQQRLTVRAAALQAGLSSATFNRIERAESASGGSLFRVMLWLEISLEALKGGALHAERAPRLPEAPAATAPDSRARFRARENLDPRTSAALAEAFRYLASLFEPISPTDAEGGKKRSRS
jgi:transcriptional regulator with XRE-family HTH domain